ncbi:homeodomain-interacting protein kinase 1-like protein [Lates japonicus]|uniref:Homeodomain-interacting protein kinase 1-like protein n=1 Tax=Lates japonicus TaxID=270547 RepID=A0AAD3NEK6_LATJO|nr:homeodomain-interacting protein kinase 1-like protein [Lates japonicus]
MGTGGDLVIWSQIVGEERGTQDGKTVIIPRTGGCCNLHCSISGTDRDATYTSLTGCGEADILEVCGFHSSLTTPESERQCEKSTKDFIFHHGLEIIIGGLISTTSSHYEVEDLLGSGAYGVVTQCRKLTTNETVAIKIQSCIEAAKEEVQHKFCVSTFDL